MNLPSHVRVRETIVVHNVRPRRVRGDFQNGRVTRFTCPMQRPIEFLECGKTVVEPSIESVWVPPQTQWPGCSWLRATASCELHSCQNSDFILLGLRQSIEAATWFVRNHERMIIFRRMGIITASHLMQWRILNNLSEGNAPQFAYFDSVGKATSQP